MKHQQGISVGRFCVRSDEICTTTEFRSWLHSSSIEGVHKELQTAIECIFRVGHRWAKDSKKRLLQSNKKIMHVLVAERRSSCCEALLQIAVHRDDDEDEDDDENEDEDDVD